MAAANPSVGLAEYHDEDKIVSYLVYGITDATAAAAAVGYAVSLHTVAGTVKLAADNDEVYGRVEACSWRPQEGICVASVALSFQGNLPLKTSETPAIGSQIIGAGSGQVKARVAPTYDPDASGAQSLSFVPGASTPNKVLTYDGTAHTVTVNFNF